MLTHEIINPAQELEGFMARNPGSGAFVNFAGQVRRDNLHWPTQALWLEAYEPLTTHEIHKVMIQTQERWQLDDMYVKHRVGRVPASHIIVFVATAAAHRRSAFEAADFLMDYLKTEAFFWKKEILTNEERWIEPRSQDYKDAKRWVIKPKETKK